MTQLSLFAAAAADTKALNWAEYTGASAGTFDPGKLAKVEIGDIDWGRATTYMLRRFGLPNLGHDDYKEIARWLITTPIDGLFLTFISRPHHTSLLFGYVVSKALDARAKMLEMAQREDRWNAYVDWSNRMRGEPPPGSDQTLDNYPGPYDTPEKRRALADEQDAIFGAFEQDSPRPAPPSEIDEMNNALRVALRDLLTPVGVRDQDINIIGIVA